MTLAFCIVFGLWIIFLVHSNYYMKKVSRNLTLNMLYVLSISKHKVDDDILLYTFYNLFMARVCLIVLSAFTLAMAGGIVWILKIT